MVDFRNLSKRPYFSKANLPAKVIISYVLDYALLLVLFLGFYALDAVEPYHQHFSLRNYTIQYPYAEKERITIYFAFFLAAICPSIIIAFYTLIVDGFFSHDQYQTTTQKWSRIFNGKYPLKERLWELNCGILGLALSEGLAFVITAVLKNATGKPRPDLIARCRPAASNVDQPIFGLSNSTICQPVSHAILKDGFRSFPSGHSSSAFAGLSYLSIYLAGKLHVFDTRGEVWKAFVVMVPTLGAALIAISRIMDARHHPFDVISGSLLGMTMAYISYRQYFPPLSESWRKGRAYPIRSWGSGPRKPRLDERQISRDQGVEPLRSAPIRVDEEQPRPRFNSPHGQPLRSAPIRTDEEQPRPRFHSPHGSPSRAATYSGPEENVFRQQISKSQRLRRAEIQHRSGHSISSAESDLRGPASPLSHSPNARGRQRHRDPELSPSTSDQGLSEEVFEMQRIPRADALASQEPGIHPAYRLTTKDFEQDTRYHSPARSPKASGLPPGFHPLPRIESTSSTRSVANEARDQGI